jgi:hypothetical protein
MASTQVLKSPDPTSRVSQLNLPPVVKASIRELTNHSPGFGLNIFSDRPGYYEVLLATNPAQLVVTGARNPSTSYSSRQDSGLIPIPLGASVYLAPTAVLRNFVKAQPRPERIYYTVVLYADEAGNQGIYAQPPETLASSAPYVGVSRHYGSDGFGDVLGMNPDRMRRVIPSASQSFSLAVAAPGPEEDRADGEDGTSAPPLPVMSRAAQDSYYEGYPGAPEPPHDYCDAPAAAAADSDYDDGYRGEPQPGSALGLSIAQQSSFRAGDPEPSVLEDESVDEDGTSYEEYRSGKSSSENGVGTSSLRSQKSSESQQAFDDDDDDDDDEDHHRGQYRLAGGGQGEGGPGARFYAQKSQSTAYPERGYPETAAATYGDEADEGMEPTPPYRSLDAPPAQTSALTIEAKRDLIGKIGDYGAIRADAEYSGVYGPEHPAYQRYHLGLSFGVALFNQEHGDLGKLLEAFRERDASKFSEIFGKETESLLRVTRSTGPSSTETPDGRSVRLQPINGADLWQEPWVSRFREAGYHKPFQAVQNKLAAELFLDPMLSFAHSVGLVTERSLAVLTDRAAELGVGPAQQWVINAVGPFQTALQRHQALAALGFESIRAFQNAHPGTDTNGQWGPMTHAAAVAELRSRGNSPVPLPSVDQMLDTFVRRSARTPSFDRVRALRHDSRLSDTPFHPGQERQQ